MSWVKYEKLVDLQTSISLKSQILEWNKKLHEKMNIMAGIVVFEGMLDFKQSSLAPMITSCRYKDLHDFLLSTILF